MANRYECEDITDLVAEARKRFEIPTEVKLDGVVYKLHNPSRVVVFHDPRELARFVVDDLKTLMSDLEDGIIMPTGNTYITIWEEAARRASELGRLARIRQWANLDENHPLDPQNPNYQLSYAVYSRTRLIEPLGIPEEQWIIPDGTTISPQVEAVLFEKKLAERKWAYAMLGVGPDEKKIGGRVIPASPHIGFIPPGTLPSGGAMYVRLDEGTKFANSQGAPDPDNFFTGAITQGPLDIGRAQRHIMVATGAYKPRNMKDVLLGPATLDKPATLMQIFPEVTYVMDSKAAGLIIREINR